MSFLVEDKKMKMKNVFTDSAPKPVGHYSHAVIAGDLVFCSGQIGIDPVFGQMVQGSFAEETHQVMKNLEAVARSAGTTLGKAIKFEVFLTDIKCFSEFNQIYEEFLEGARPARQVVEVNSLPMNANIEISCILYMG